MSTTNKTTEQLPSSSDCNFTTPLRKPLKSHIETPFVIPPSPLLENLGYGTGVKVFRIERSPRMGTARSPWAIKKICKRNAGDGDDKIYKERLTEEAALLRKLDHTNIVGYRGYKSSIDGNDALMLEDCHISLGNILETRNEEELSALPANNIKIMCRDISKALDYLHTTAFLLHCDLKSFNVLIKGDFEICKLCDFGVSQPLNKDGYLDLEKKPTAAYVGTDLWSAPEVFVPENEENISFKADIFSFGMIIYECITLMPPHISRFNDDKENSIISISDVSDAESEHRNKLNPNVSSITISDSEDGNDTEKSSFDIQVVLGTRPPLPEATTLSEDYNIVVELFYMCTNMNPEDRPTAKCIIDSI